MSEQPELPYGVGEDANSGYSGSETSEARARAADADGTTARRQAQVLDLLARQRADGLTWKDVSTALDVHHGGASGVLSVLHKVGRIARLTETRGRCKVYVLPEYVGERICEPHGRRGKGAQAARYEVQAEFTGAWVTIPSTGPLLSPQEADAFVEQLRTDWPGVYEDASWRVVELTCRTHHTLTY